MNNKISFVKMQGLGNDFVVIDATQQQLTMTPALAQAMADRHYGIGCDQVLVIEPSQIEAADFNYRIFNSDGMEVGQCGNGARCVARYLYDHGLVRKKTITLATVANKLEATIAGADVIVNMGIPTFIPHEIPFMGQGSVQNYPLKINDAIVLIDALGLGNPHAVLQVAKIEDAPVGSLGPQIEQHPLFPKHTNVEFMQIISPREIKLRVFERGVGETLACGSGACAAVVSGKAKNQLAEKVTVHLPGGELIIDWSGDANPVLMQGPAVEVFSGTWRQSNTPS